MRILSSKIGIVVFLALSVIVIFPGRALAYLDPGTGSFIFQTILAVVLGSLFALKVFWKRIRLFFKNILTKNNVGGKAD
ncbi:MAG: hypothetical protein V3W18_08660 [candidate division Zixibacteria bacterium]